MACPGCGKTKKPRAKKVEQSYAQQPEAPTQVTGDLVNLEYLGSHVGPVTLRGPETGREYRFGRTEGHVIRPVDVRDAEVFLQRTTGGKPVFRKV